MRRLHPYISSVRLLASFTEGPVKHNHSPDGATISLWQRHIGWMSQIFLTPFHLAPSFGCDPLRIYGKASRFLKLEFSRQPTCTAFDWSTRVTDGRTDRRTDRIAMAKTRYRSSCCCALKRCSGTPVQTVNVRPWTVCLACEQRWRGSHWRRPTVCCEPEPTGCPHTVPTHVHQHAPHLAQKYTMQPKNVLKFD